MRKIVIDANVFISALLGSPVCSQIYEYLKEDEFELLFSLEILNELIHVIHREKFGLSMDTMKSFIELICEKSTFVFPEQKISICRDIEDNKMLECALAGNANFIITGDKDLLSLKRFRKIPVITPSKFLKIFKLSTL